MFSVCSQTMWFHSNAMWFREASPSQLIWFQNRGCFWFEPIMFSVRYNYRHLRLALRKRRIIPRIARCGVEPKNRLGRYRWVVEWTLSWLNHCLRLKIRYEHRADIHLAFLQLGCALISLRFLG